MCRENKKVKAIFNIRNFGQNNSPFYGLLQTTGDCSITMSCDFQDPVEMIQNLLKSGKMVIHWLWLLSTSSQGK